jgi:DNA damage-binding protein 1
MSQNEVEASPILSTLLFGTINGVIGVVANITQEAFELLQKVQHNMTHVVRGVGGLKHAE